jgi:superoxide dismutase, Fe-Mn family
MKIKLVIFLTSHLLIYSDSEMKYKYTLPELPYKYDALEPYIDEATMKVHHEAHHKTYVDNLNKALESNIDLQSKTLVWLLQNLHQIKDKGLRTQIQNNGGGHWNHSFFWKIMKPNSDKFPKEKVNLAIKKQFGSFDKFKDKFNAEAKKVFGSGWVWLSVNKKGKLVITTTKNQDSPISNNLKPILGLDVWEHAYYLKYQNKRIDYINSWWNVINWQQVEENLINAC